MRTFLTEFHLFKLQSTILWTRAIFLCVIYITMALPISVEFETLSVHSFTSSLVLEQTLILLDSKESCSLLHL